jgi:hypothetical protein
VRDTLTSALPRLSSHYLQCDIIPKAYPLSVEFLALSIM